jgi:dTDP-4-dehydrorhamnose reductase
MRILILGHTGMLGHMVHKYFSTKPVNVEVIEHRWPSRGFKESMKDYDGDFIINCIGAIHQKTKNFDINWELPIFLDFYTKCKIIHPGTDCEMDDDQYGKSKRIARNFIINDSRNTKSLKTSIIGPEISSDASLMGWFLSNKDHESVYGYSKCYWNGNTTLTWAEKAYDLLLDWDKFDNETILSSVCISKKELLDSLNEVFERKINVLEKEDQAVNKCLLGDIKTPHIKDQLKVLKKFYYDRN